MKINFLSFLVLPFIGFVCFASVASAKNLGTIRDLTIEQIEYDEKSRTISVSGQLPNLCVSKPTPYLEKIEGSDQLVLKVFGVQAGDFCIQLVPGPFALAFDVRVLKKNVEELNLDPNKSYTIVTDSIDFSIEVDFSEVSIGQKFSKFHVANGLLQVENDGRAVVVVNEKEAFNLNSPSIEVSSFSGNVEIQGYLVKNASPVLVPGKLPSDKPTILVTGINATAE